MSAQLHQRSWKMFRYLYYCGTRLTAMPVCFVYVHHPTTPLMPCRRTLHNTDVYTHPIRTQILNVSYGSFCIYFHLL